MERRVSVLGLENTEQLKRQNWGFRRGEGEAELCNAKWKTQEQRQKEPTSVQGLTYRCT